MSIGIYYFSGTGNSLALARDIASALDGAALIPITKALKDEKTVAYDIVGIIFPVYVFGLPLIVAEFLRSLNVSKNSYIFAVANFGGIPGRPLTLAGEILSAKGLTLASGFCIKMPGNYTPLYGAIPDADQQRIFSAAHDKIKYIASLVRDQKNVREKEAPALASFLLYCTLYKAASGLLRGEDKDFWVTEKCIHCGLCEKVCPVANIRLNEGNPVWLHHCEQCMACLQWCPVEAIQYKKNTVGRKRYHHPGIKATDIMEQR